MGYFYIEIFFLIELNNKIEDFFELKYIKLKYKSIDL